jgi:hypothetical protein
MSKLIGKVAECGQKIIGVISYTRNMSDGTVIYHGVSFDGKKWQSKMPRIIANSINEYLEKNSK